MVRLRLITTVFIVCLISVIAVTATAPLIDAQPPIAVNLLTQNGARVDAVALDTRTNITHRTTRLQEVPDLDLFTQPDYVYTSPDGTATATISYDENSRKYDLYLTDANGDEALIAHFVNTTIYWSPNGEILYYFVFRLGGTEIELWTYDLTTGRTNLFLSNFGAWFNCNNVDAAWCWISSPYALVYVAVNLDTQTVVQLGRHDYYLSPAWAENSLRLAFSAPNNRDSTEIRIYDAQSGGFYSLAALPMPHDGASSMLWSPDEQWIATATTQDDSAYGLVLIPTDRSTPTAIDVTPHAARATCFSPKAWSPDSTVLLVEISLSCYAQGAGDLYAYSLTDNRLTQVTHFNGVDAVSAAWSPDGTTIAVLSERLTGGYLKQAEVAIYSTDYTLLRTRQLHLQAGVSWSDAALGW